MPSATTWDQLYDEARIYVNGRERGKLVEPASMKDQVIDFYHNGFEQGHTFSMWPEFSKHFRAARREFTVITGIPGHGKSEFCDAMALKLAEAHDWNFAVFSPENYPYAVHIEKLASKLNGLPFHNGPSMRMDETAVLSALEWINKRFVFVQPDEDNISLEGILSLTLRAKTKRRIDCLILDPWNEVDHNRPAKKSETEYIGESLMKIRRFARMNDLAVWVVAHPAKMHKVKDEEAYRPPEPYDVAGSSHWYNKADNCITVYRNADNTVDLHIKKIKFKMRGHTGIVKMNYDKINGRYDENETQKPAFTDF
jgi:twinkle protein